MQVNTVETEYIKKIVQESNLQHIAIIMDGNRRWAKSKFLPSAAGHKKGVDSLRAVIKACLALGIKYLTVYAFSTENWNRKKEEVEFLISLLDSTIKLELPEFKKNNIKVNFIGDKESLGSNLQNLIQSCEEKTSCNEKLNLQIAFNYGARAEITCAVKTICQKVLDGDLKISDIKEDIISQNLYTSSIPDPELLIRTGGDKRISNYLLWQCAYTEIYVTDKFWPEFDENALYEAIIEFKTRHRRFGK